MLSCSLVGWLNWFSAELFPSCNWRRPRYGIGGRAGGRGGGAGGGGGGGETIPNARMISELILAVKGVILLFRLLWRNEVTRQCP